MKNNYFYLCFLLITGILFAQPGSMDTTFNLGGTGANSRVIDAAILPDGKILIVGQFTSYNGTTANRIARLNPNGSLDTSFNSGGTGFDATAISIYVQSDGKILVGGFFFNYNSITRNRLVRLNPDGSLDTTFAPSIGPDNNVSDIAIQPDGKIVIVGSFTNYNDVLRRRIARVNPDGSLDTTFVPPGTTANSGANNPVYSVALQTDGNIWIGGIFNGYGGVARSGLARLLVNGGLDPALTGSGIAGDVSAIEIQPDGKIMIGGGFGSYNGVARKDIARLNSDGTLDTTFNPGGVVVNGVATLAVLPDGKIMIGGRFTSYDGVGRVSLARLNANGTLDTAFNPGTGANSFGIDKLAVQPDGKTVIVGNFTSYNGITTNYIARVKGDILEPVIGQTFAVNGINYIVTKATLPYEVAVGDNRTFVGEAANIPADVTNSGNTFAVTSIGHSAFSFCAGLTTLNLPNFITSIGNNAFNGCNNLQSINLPASITYLGDYAFANCNGLTSVYVNWNTALAIGSTVFDYNRLYINTTLYVPAGTRNAYLGVFPYYTFKTINDPSYVPVPQVGDTFAVDGFNYRITKDTAPFEAEVGNNTNFVGAATIPATVSNAGNSFAVTSIGDYAFFNCSGLTTVSITTGVTSIGVEAFGGCSGLTSVSIGNSVISIGERAFNGCIALTSVSIPNSVTSINRGTFSSCTGLTSVNIPNSVTSIGQTAFSNCSKLTSVVIPDSVTSIVSEAFSSCSGLTSVSIGNSVTFIGSEAFGSCSGLTSINIPESVEIIDIFAFDNCPRLTSVTVNWAIPIEVGAEIFGFNFDDNGDLDLSHITLHVPAGTQSAYDAAEVWTYFRSVNDVDNVFNYCRGAVATTLVSPFPAGSIVKWYTVATGGLASLIPPTPSTTTVGTKLFYVSQVVGGVESARETITVNTIALPTTPTALVLTNDAAVLPATPITAVGVYVGSGVSLKLTATAAAATSYIWTLPVGVTLADGTTTGVVTSVGNTINVLISASSDTSSLVVSVKSVNLSRCASLSRTLTLTRAPAVAPGSLRMNNGITTTAITTFAPYMGTTRILRLSAAVSATATSYVWELPIGVTRVTSIADATPVTSTESTLPEIFVTFTGVTSSNTFNYNTTARVPVSTNVLRIGVFGKNGTGLSTTVNATLVNPPTVSTARLLTLTAIRPAAPTALKLTNAAAVAPATAATAIVDISRFIGTSTELTLTATISKLASEYVWDLPTGTVITDGATTTVSNSIKVNFSNVSAGAATYYLGVFAKNGINTSTRDNSLLVPAVPVSSANARVLKVAALVANFPSSLISRNNGGVSTTNISSFIGTSTPLTLTTAVVPNALSYTYTVPAGVDIIEDSVGVSTTSSTSFTTTLTTITVNYQNVAPGVASIPVAVRANNFVGSSANRPLNLTAAAPATPTVTGVLAICSTAATNVVYTIPTLAVGATSYFITAPAGATVNGGTDNAAILAVLESTFTINYPSGFIANSTTSKRAIIIQSINGFGVNVVSRTLNLTNVGAVCPAPPVAPVTVFNVTPNGSVSYTINGTVGSPTLTLARGTTYTFNVSSVGHPFNINTINTTGTASQYNDGITNNNITSGTLTFVVGASAPSTLYYNCAFHTNQGGVINVIDAPARFSSASVANGFKVIAYPNPSSSEFTIETSAKGAINVKVYDMQGRLVEKADTNKVGARLAAGTYNVIVNQGTNNKSVRVIKK